MPKTEESPRIAWTLHSEQGPPTLLIMGTAMAGHVWRPQVDGLADRLSVLTFDHRSVGESDDWPGPWTTAELASDAVRVMDAAGWSSAHVVGVSMGGMVAQELALNSPGRVRSLTLIATTSCGRRARSLSVGRLAKLAGALFTPGDFPFLARILYPLPFMRVTSRDALERRLKDQTRGNPNRVGRRKQLAAVFAHDTRARLHQLRMPTLVVRAGDDLLMPAVESDRLASSIPTARLVSFDRAGHGIVYQCASALNRELAGHIESAERVLPGSEQAVSLSDA